jgi:hypothetical protein
MLAVALVVALALSLGLIYDVHGNPAHWPTLGAWARPLEAASLSACALLVIALVRLGRKQRTSSQPLKLAFYVLTLAWLSGLFHAYEQGASYYSLVIGLGLWAALVSFGPWLREKLRDRTIRALDLVAMNLCLLVVGAELSLRLAARFVHSPLLVQESTDARDFLAANKLRPGQLRFGFPANSRGYYDDELAPNAGCLVTAVGDSFTVGVVPHEYHFASVAERALGCPIAQIGVCAVGPEEYALMLRDDALPLGPDVVLIDIFVGNDIVENLRGRDHFRGGLRHWLDRQNVLVWAVPRRLAKIVRSQQKQGDVAREPPFSVERTLGHDELLAAYPWLVDPLREPPSLDHDWYMNMETRHALDDCGGGDEGSYARFYEIMREMQARVRTAKKTLAVLLIPDEFQVEDPLWAELQARLHVPLERDRPQRLLSAWLRAEKVPFLDLLPALRAQPVATDGRRHLYHRDDSHLNARGNAVAGEALAAFLRPLLPRR